MYKKSFSGKVLDAVIGIGVLLLLVIGAYLGMSVPYLMKVAGCQDSADSSEEYRACIKEIEDE